MVLLLLSKEADRTHLAFTLAPHQLV